MAKYKVVKTFPSKSRVVRGQILDDPRWRNLKQLIRQGYVKLVGDDVPASPAPIEVPAEETGELPPIGEFASSEPVPDEEPGAETEIPEIPAIPDETTETVIPEAAPAVPRKKASTKSRENKIKEKI